MKTSNKKGTPKQRATRIAEQCADAYSADRYRSWTNVALVLVNRGYSDRQVEAIMRSKWTRWAGDAIEDHSKGIRYGNLPARAITEFIDDMKTRRGVEAVVREIVEITTETFGVAE